MKPTARLAYLIIILFFIFFNGLIIYLVSGRITETKNRIGFACQSALAATLSDYHKLKSVDSAAMPSGAWVAYSREPIELSRTDSQSISLRTSSQSLITDTIEPAVTEIIVNSPAFKSVNMQVLHKLFSKALRAQNIHSAYRLDTLTIRERKRERQLFQVMWEQKKQRGYQYSTSPMRLPYFSHIFIFAEVKRDNDLLREQLLWPLLAFIVLLIIGNTALVFVYKTIRKQKMINELKTDFINNLTHEMKTPITVATAGLEALEHHIEPADRTTFYVQTSKKQLHLLNDFVERILDSAVQDLSDFHLKTEKLELKGLFNELIESHKLLHTKQVNFDLHAETPVYINGDRLHLVNAFHNIIDNAVKYANGSVNIIIDIIESGRECTIKISDNGKGIPQQYLKNIFEKFFRVPQGDAQPVKGFGLGLYYVNSIIRKHGGNIVIRSGSQGTTFIINIPKNL